MGDLGAGLAFGAGAASDAYDAIRKRIADAEQQKFNNTITQREQDRADATLKQNEELKRLQIESALEAKRGAESDRQTGLANTLADQLPAKTPLAPSDPAVGMLQRGGRGSLLQHQDPTLASTQYDGASTLPSATGAPMTGSLRMVQQPGNPEQYLKLPSEKQNDTSAELGRKSQATQAAIDAKVEALNQAAEHMKMQGDVATANILRAQAEAALANAKAAHTDTPKPITLSAQGKSARAAIEQAAPLTDRVMEMIRKEAPDIETHPEKYNTAMGKLQALGQTLKYKAGYFDETDPRQQLVSLLQPIQAGQYTRSSRSRQMLDLALKHMADPTQTLLTQYQRAKELKGIMPEMLQGIVRAETPVDAANPLGGSYFDPATQHGAQEFDYVPGKGLVPRKP